jgi:hypothetical protein
MEAHREKELLANGCACEAMLCEFVAQLSSGKDSVLSRISFNVAFNSKKHRGQKIAANPTWIVEYDTAVCHPTHFSNKGLPRRAVAHQTKADYEIKGALPEWKLNEVAALK